MSTGQPFGKTEHAYFTGTTSAAANDTTVINNILPRAYTGASLNYINVEGAGATVYLENGWSQRDGLSFPKDDIQIDGDDPISGKVIRLGTSQKYVVFSNVDSAKLEATVFDLVDGVIVPGTITTINDYGGSGADTDSWNAISLGTAGTHFAVIYRDSGGSSYVYGRIGSVSGTTITMGDEKALDGANAGVEVSGVRYGICEPRAGVLFFTFHDSDTHLTALAAPYSGVTIGILATQNKPDGTNAPTVIACCPAGANKVFVAFGTGAEAGNLHGRVATVSATGTIGSWGTEKDLLGLDGNSDAAGTSIEVVNVETDKVMMSYIEAADDPSMCAYSISGTTITGGQDIILETTTATDMGITMRDANRGFLKWDNGTYGRIISFSLDGVTTTADAVLDYFQMATTAGCTTGGLVHADNNQVIVIYQDAASDLFANIGTYFENRIIDVRSATASIAYTGTIVPNFSKKETLAKI